MSRYKFLILILMVMKSLYYSEALDLRDILRNDESETEFTVRMTDRGLPIVGEPYLKYEERFKEIGNSASAISKEEYQILMDSIPRINESLQSVNGRNTKIQQETGHNLQLYTQEEINNLKLRYPRVYETLDEYKLRMRTLAKLIPTTVFTLLKNYCPSIGEIYDEYLYVRKESFGILGYSAQEFTVFLESYPTIIENDVEFLKRVDLESLGVDMSNSSKYYLGLWSLIPIFAETYEEYSNRMKSKLLVPMKSESFVLYQAYYPNLCVQYTEFTGVMKRYEEQRQLRLKKLKFIIYSEDTYNHLKTKFPKPYESQILFENRLIQIDGSLHLIFDRFFAKRMYPKMSETYKEYSTRIETKLHLKPIPENMFIEYKKNYPQINIEYKKIEFENKENATHVQKRNLFEITIDEVGFKLLVKRLPMIYENYSMYRERMSKIDLEKFKESNKEVREKFKTTRKRVHSIGVLPKIDEDYQSHGQGMSMIDTNLLDEEDFDDLKKIYIKQCEIYKDYEIRMAQMHIKPMTVDIAKHFKMSVPREYERYDGSYYDVIFDSDSNKFIQDKSDEYMPEIHCIKLFKYKNYRVFMLIRPRLFERYESYVIRINTFRENYDFHDFTELKPQERVTFKTFIQPLTKDEFLDLKLRFPKLSETPNDYEYRLRNEYGINPVIDNNKYHLFNIIKHSQIQLYDNFEKYERRYNKLAINKKKILQDLGISLVSIDEFSLFKKCLPTMPYVVDYYGYNIAMKGFGNKCILDENDYEDFTSIFPKYYNTFAEYNELMKNRHLDEISFDHFKVFKEVHPHFLDKSFEDYQLRAFNHNLVKERQLINELEKFNSSIIKDRFEFETFINSIPTPYESFKSYQTRLSNVSDTFYKSGDFDRFKRIYPTASSTADEYFQLSKSLALPDIDNCFNTYKRHLPIFKVDHINRILPKYNEYTKSLESYKMTDEEYNLWFLRLPKAHERYSSYEQRMIKLKENYPKILPLEKYEFHDLKKLFSISYETFKEHKSRLESYGLTPLTEIQFKNEKACRVLVGETFDSHVERILELFRDSAVLIDINNKEETMNNIINDEGVETLISNNFVEHVLSYPFDYDTYEMFLTRQNKIKSELEPDPLVKTEIWYTKMKSVLPRINETPEKFKERVKTYGLDFPEITVIDFYRHIYAMPHPAESYSTFYKRTTPNFLPDDRFSDNIINKIIPIPPLVIEAPIPESSSDNAVLTPPKEEPEPQGSLKGHFASLIATERPTYFILCPIINNSLKNFKREVYNNFVAISPNFVIGYTNYHDKVKELKGEPLTLEEFNVFKQCLPKLQESILEHDKYITSIGLAEIGVEVYNKLKIFYPRIYHISYDNYILDIELKFGKEATDYRGVIDALKLSRDEFDEYIKSFPNLFDFSYGTYLWRKKDTNNTILFTKDEFNLFKKANFPRPDENYEQHKENMDYLAIDPIPNDVFLFFKRLYPDLFEKRYEFRITNMVFKELQHVNYNDDKYKLDNKIVSEIIKKSNPSKEQHDKVQKLLQHKMSNEEFRRLTSFFPMVFRPYTFFVSHWESGSDSSEAKIFKSFNKAYFPLINETYMEYKTRMKSLNLTVISSHMFRYLKSEDGSDAMEEELFKSFKKAYFPLINETYMEYKTRMKSLSLTAISSNMFRYLKSIYPHIFNNYNTYSEDVKFYKTNELRFVNKFVNSKIQLLGYYKFQKKDYSIFQKNFPRIFDSLAYFKKCLAADQMPIVFNHDDFDSVKTAYYPRLSENYDSYKARMIGIGLWVLDYKIFKILKAVYPNPMISSYYEYKTIFNEKNIQEDKHITEKHIMTEKEFNKNLMNDFPKLFESWEEFYERRLLTSSEDEENRLINDDGIFSKNLFNDMKIVYLPKLGQYYSTFIVQNINYLDLPFNRAYWKIYFINIMKLYPIFFESYVDYNNRLENSTCPLEYLKLNENRFYRFFQIFPFPYETYSQYTKRNVKETTHILSEDEFIHFRRVFPQLSETYIEYKKRMTSSLCIQFVTKEMFVLFKSLFPQIDEAYDTYKKRFYDSLINSDDETKKQLSFFVEYMKFHAFDYETSKGTEITAETSEATSIKVYGAMTFEEFEVFKLSLPIPNERREDYINRINKLASFAKRDGIKEHVEPEILPEELFLNLVESYPEKSDGNYDDYLKNMEDKNSIAVSKDTLQELLKVSKSMAYNPYTFDYTSFYKIIVTSKNQLSHQSWPWYVDTILAKRN